MSENISLDKAYLKESGFEEVEKQTISEQLNQKIQSAIGSFTVINILKMLLTIDMITSFIGVIVIVWSIVGIMV
jgi:uncharacterized membrane protein